MPKKIRVSTVPAFATAIGLSIGLLGLLLLPRANAQISEQEFQMGRAREACIEQTRQQSLIFNNVVSTIPNSSGGQMIGSEVILNVGRAGATYDIQCSYNNASRTATIVSVPGGSTGNSTSPTLEGSFSGKGLTSGSVFGKERETDASLNFNGNNFSFSLAVPPGTGAQVVYSGTITRQRRTGSTNSGSFRLIGRVRSFASSDHDLRVINAAGDCQIEVFDSRVTSSSCNTRVRNSSTYFQGLQQF
jgi:hypothetical protein